jgi:putative membrane protein
MHAHELLAPGAFAAIEEAVRGAERATSGEIVPMVVERSDSYSDVRIAAAALLAIASGALLLALTQDLEHWLVPCELAVFAGGLWLFGRRALLARVTPHGMFDERVHSSASLAFHHAGVVETRERTGILLYVSLLERRVQVLADRGIHDRVPDGTWDGVVERILAGIRDGHADRGLVEGIRLCGEILARHFPPRPDDANELPDRPRSG